MFDSEALVEEAAAREHMLHDAYTKLVSGVAHSESGDGASDPSRRSARHSASHDTLCGVSSA